MVEHMMVNGNATATAVAEAAAVTEAHNCQTARTVKNEPKTSEKENI